MSAQVVRMKRELEILSSDPGPGVSAWTLEDNMTNLEAQILGPADSPFEEGTYLLSVQIPSRYPFEPPRVRFLTPIYHPNIDQDGRICLDTLKMQPQGTWSPSININTLLLTIRMLMQSPNVDDGLSPEITEEYKRDVGLWRRKALEHTRKNAVPKLGSIGSNSIAPPETLPGPIVSVSSEPACSLGKRQRPKSDAVDEQAPKHLEDNVGSDNNDNDDDDDEDFYVN